uniref:Membrane fusion protein, Cu(I)/Ag(I) efflux system n=1 Tax=Candidatus Kentrum sp. FM TaxID=2126340 RepID=A0A450S8E7_9GAMM|nr:MAG: membrane fusion protein, Cu(I)/Ag(I) efflux system [Candidatus Kentron sp. FM]VFJ55731.1 MAG: membrane fusion protein, Cu(I)/Ag(I) efflux system [Candidatus Kentron sp. FM]VFK07979.1 MAG: membrane fusion protein, Cu(I)/Ag(I) efflux system [Candidatus Kentron sp. FM]
MTHLQSRAGNKQVKSQAVMAALFVATVLAALFFTGSAFAARKYTCPMHPHYIAGEPGTCPICGMDLVPIANAAKTVEETGKDLSAPDGETDTGTRAAITIPPETIQNIGVRTEQAAMVRFGTDIRSYGVVTENARTTHVISGRVAGWIEELHITAVGDEVKEGDLLFTLYSPELISAQQDYIAAIKGAIGGRIASSAKRLRSLGIGNKALEEIKTRRRKLEHPPFYAETGGIVSHLMVSRGSYLKPGMQVATIQDYSSVWVEVSVAEKDLEFLKKNSKATVTFPNLGGMTRLAHIDYIHPTIDSDSRTGRVRLVLDNPDGNLKPGAYADVVFETDIDKRLGIPSEAILKSSEGDFVVAALGEGRFQPRKVETGIRNKGRTEIVDGLTEGETVVVSGQFLIDSESSLRESFRKLQKLQTGLAALKVTGDQQAMIDHLIDAALYLHETITGGQELEAEILASALRVPERLLPKFRGTKLQFILQDARDALNLAKDAVTRKEQQLALAWLVSAVKPWITEGRPEYYKDNGIKRYLDHGGGNEWLQLEGEVMNPYGEGRAVEVELNGGTVGRDVHGGHR